jgi:hypothetical protein
LNEIAEATLFIALIAGGIVAGGQLFCLLAVIPAFGDWSDRSGVSVHQSALSERPHRYLRVVSPIAVVAALATVAIEHSTDLEVILIAIAFVASLFNGIYSQREWPINHEIDSYGDAPTEEQVVRYAELRKKWDEQHVVRTVATMLAFALLAGAAVIA